MSKLRERISPQKMLDFSHKKRGAGAKPFYFGITLASMLILCLGLGAQPASAHVLKTDGAISTVLHTEPDDNPTAGAPVHFLLYFADANSQLDLANCICGATISENGHQLSSQTPRLLSSLESEGVVTFPRADIYTMQVSGRPKMAGEFQPFAATYTLRVTASNTPPKKDNQQPWWLLGIGVFVALVIAACAKRLAKTWRSGAKNNHAKDTKTKLTGKNKEDS